MPKFKRTAKPPAAPAATIKSASFTTSDFSVVRKLHAAGILARQNYGSPAVFEYALEDRGRIDAVLGT